MRFIDVGEGETDDEVSRDEMHNAMKRALEHAESGMDAEVMGGGAAANGEAKMAMIAHALVLRRLDEFNSFRLGIFIQSVGSRFSIDLLFNLPH